MAGEIALNTQRLDSINDASELYEDYYGTYMKENPLSASDDLLIAAGIIAFLDRIHLDYADRLLPLLQPKNISLDTFIESIRKLNDMEVVDIFFDKAVRFSEQSLSNYLLKYVYFDRKLISLKTMLKVLFISNRGSVVASINTLLNVFRKKELHDFIESEVLAAWDELKEEQPDVFPEFVKVFFRFRPNETLLILKQAIEDADETLLGIDDIDMSSHRSYRNTSDEIIEMLSGFADMEDLPTALDLMFAYYLKRPDLFTEFCSICTNLTLQ